jgi:hypothetical protein
MEYKDWQDTGYRGFVPDGRTAVGLKPDNPVYFSPNPFSSKSSMMRWHKA